ncbi:MAG: S9 family peptidase [Bacteroidales bacterium]|jgi:dipeptidyl aminopeptidase/acylaminoacyl peptidase|nr:S9 family peptidase [Bacteroidales bacterium]
MKFLIRHILFITFLLLLVSGCKPKPEKPAEKQPVVISEQPEPLTDKEIANKRLTPEILWKFGRLGEFSVSPDGKKIVYTVTRYQLSENKGRTTIWMIHTNGGEPMCLTADVPQSCFHPRWHPSGERVTFLTSVSGSTQIWDMNPNGTLKRQVSYIEGGINGFEYSPKGDAVMFLKNVSLGKSPKELYPDLPQSNAIISDDLMYRHWDSWTDYTVSHIWIGHIEEGVLRNGHDIMDGEPFDAPMSPYFDENEICWSPDGRYIAYTCKKLTGKEYALSTNSDIYLFDLEDGTTKNITDGMPGYDKYPVFSPDGNMIAFQSMATPGYESDKERLMIYHLSSGKTEDLTARYGNNASDFIWTPDSKHLRFISGVRATYQIYSVDIASKAIKPITKGKHNYNSISLAGEEIVGSKTTMNMASELFCVDPQTGAERQLTFINKNIYDALRLGEVKERTVKTSDGKDMLVWVVYPPDFDPKKKYPTLLYCQGGPQNAVSHSFSYRWNMPLMAANDYIIVAPNRRGVPTFGQEWNRQISGDYGGQNMRDYLSAIDDVKKEPYVDENRLGAVGASYGGFSVFWLAGHHEKRFKALIAHCGMFNFESQYGTTEEYWFVNFDLGGPYWQKPRPKSYDFSPHLSVDKWDAPILVIHGAKDFRVPYSEGLQAFHAAQLRGVPSRLLVFPEEGHWILKPQNSILWQREFFGWLDKWLK